MERPQVEDNWSTYCIKCNSFTTIWTDSGGWDHEICKCWGSKWVYWDGENHHQCVCCGKQRNHWDCQPVGRVGICWDCREKHGLPRRG